LLFQRLTGRSVGRRFITDERHLAEIPKSMIDCVFEERRKRLTRCIDLKREQTEPSCFSQFGRLTAAAPFPVNHHSPLEMREPLFETSRATIFQRGVQKAVSH
jgi:hypothetical protein